MKSLFTEREMGIVKKLVAFLNQQGEKDLESVVYAFNGPLIDIESIILRLQEKKIIQYRVGEKSDLPRIFIKLIMKPAEIQELIYAYGKLRLEDY